MRPIGMSVEQQKVLMMLAAVESGFLPPCEYGIDNERLERFCALYNWYCTRYSAAKRRDENADDGDRDACDGDDEGDKA